MGVLFVHGIGQQSESSCLREFSAPILAWLGDWFADNTGERLVLSESQLSYGDPTAGHPAHLEVTVPSAGPELPAESWVFAEAWWASRLEAPALLTMTAWSFGALWRVAGQLAFAAVRRWRDVLKHVARGGRDPDSAGQRLVAGLGILIESTSQLLLAVGYLVGAAAGYLLLLPVIVAALLPIPPLQNFLLLRVLRPFLLDFVGDFRVYALDEVQGLHIRRAVEDAIDWLAAEADCDAICVIAHSQGAVVAYDAIANGRARANDRVTKLITMGGALNRAWELADRVERFNVELPKGVRWLDIWTAYDPVPGGPVSRGRVTSHQVTNEMNVLRDHGGYFHNREEVISRLVQEIDQPRGDCSASRFAFTDQAYRVTRRWTRVTTLVGWRLVAMFLFGLVAVTRQPRLLSDGRAAWEALEHVPGVAGVRAGVAAVMQTVSDVANAAAGATEPLPPVSLGLQVVRELFKPSTLEPLWKVALALGILALAFTAFYFILTRLLYEPWRDRDGRRAVLATLPRQTPVQRTMNWLRAFAVPLALLVFAFLLRPY